MPVNVDGCSLFQYSKNGDPQEVAISKNLVLNIKKGRTAFLTPYINNLQALNPFFGNGVLVPAPSSKKLLQNAMLPSRNICQFLVQNGIANHMQEILVRNTTVPKSAFQVAKDRLKADGHYQSISCTANPTINPPDEFIIVDDVITLGSTTIGCYLRLREVFPDAQIKIFSLFRTMNFDEDVMVNHVNPQNLRITLYDSGKTWVQSI